MRKATALFLYGSMAVAVSRGAVPPRDTMDLLANQPVRFEPESSDNARFVARGLPSRLVLSGNGVTATTGDQPVALRFEGSRPARLEGQNRLRSATNLIRGSDASLWRHGIPNFARVVAHNVYPGIDVAYYGAGGTLEYDLILRPGADPRQIRLRLEGPVPARLDARGNLIGGLVHQRPVAYQVAADGTRDAVESRFRLTASGSFRFALGRYDRKRELIIDPQLTLSAYFGGSLAEAAVSVGHDRLGFLYVGGTTYSSDLPGTGNGFQTTLSGASDIFVAKIDPNAAAGAQVVYTTYIGGTGADTLHDMAVGADGTVYLTGSTTSADFPLGNAAQSALSGTSDGFVLWLDPTQSGAAALYYGTYLGGSGDDAGNGIAVEASGRILVTGQTTSTDLVTAGGYLASSSGSSDAFVAVIDTGASGAGTLVYSTYLGGSGWDAGRGIAAAPDGTVWITGATYSADFPIAGAAYQSAFQGGGDAFITQINPNVAGGSSLVYSTYLGGSGTEEANKLFLDASGRVIVTGFTLSTDFPITAAAVQGHNAGAADAFVAMLDPAITANPSAQLVYSTYLGGSDGDEGYAVTADAAGNVYVAGLTKSADFPVSPGALQTTSLGGPAGFVVRLNPARAGQADFSTYITSDGDQTAYGLEVDAKGTIYVAGFSTGPLLDLLGGATKTTDPGNPDAYLMGFQGCSLSAATLTAQFDAAGGTATIALTGTPGCAWTAASGTDWITVSPTSGAGSGQITLTAAPNRSGADRTAVVTVAGVSITVTQGQ